MSGLGYQDDVTEATDERDQVGLGGLPSEGEMVLLCLDFLRDLRRSYKVEDLALAEGIDADQLSTAIYSLSRVFIRPSQLSFYEPDGNDAWMDRNKANTITPRCFPSAPTNNLKIPDMNVINSEILYPRNPNVADDSSDEGTNDEDIEDWYEYDDGHESNLHRFYTLNGLASGSSLKGPLTLSEITAAGLAGLGARSRLDAEREMIKSPLFEQFVAAVEAKGFFRDPDTEQPRKDPNEEIERRLKAAEIYNERFRKVVAKFRSKLATKALQQDGQLSPSFLGGSVTGNLLVLSAVDRHQKRRERRIQLARVKWSSGNHSQLLPIAKISTTLQPQETPSYTYPPDQPTPDLVSTDKGLSVVTALTKKLAPQSPTTRTLKGHHPSDLEEAERLKAQGNAAMLEKDYQGAADAYTAALKLSPAGPQSHVYFSNRAAALLSMKKFDEAILDSERSLALKPDYGKAHARLGLAHFLLGNYRQAMEAYTVSLKYEPDNNSSQSYLAKASKRMAKQEGDDEATSFSVVSEWDKSEGGKSYGSTLNQRSDRKQFFDHKEAEHFKAKGNSYMANRDYKSALEAYSAALQLCSDGDQSHVYFSNRAAALCYLERYEEAEHDAEQSLALNPTYGKAHARLGLSQFFMGDYAGAVAAYTRALQFDPDNAASKSYLQKAKARFDRASSSVTEDTTNISILDAVFPEQTQRRKESSTSSRKVSTPSKHKVSSSRKDNPAVTNEEMPTSSFAGRDEDESIRMRDPRLSGSG